MKVRLITTAILLMAGLMVSAHAQDTKTVKKPNISPSDLQTTDDLAVSALEAIAESLEGLRIESIEPTGNKGEVDGPVKEMRFNQAVGGFAKVGSRGSTAIWFCDSKTGQFTQDILKSPFYRTAENAFLHSGRTVFKYVEFRLRATQIGTNRQATLVYKCPYYSIHQKL